jgi:hypothetical protein
MKGPTVTIILKRLRADRTSILYIATSGVTVRDSVDSFASLQFLYRTLLSHSRREAIQHDYSHKKSNCGRKN